MDLKVVVQGVPFIFFSISDCKSFISVLWFYLMMIVLRRGRNFAIKSRYFVTFAIEPLSTLKPKRVGIIIEKFEGFLFLNR